MKHIYKKHDVSKKYNLPKEVKFCKKCVISNQRPRIVFDEEGVCNACRFSEYKKTIDWNSREDELMKICDQHRSKSGNYDCVVPSSGGKDSGSVTHKLKHKYGMHPLNVTYSPLVSHPIGWQNLVSLNWAGFDTIIGMARGDVQRRLCKEAMVEIGEPFQPFIYGQVLFPINIAMKYGIKLIFGGENAEAEYGGSPNAWDKKSHNYQDLENYYYSKIPMKYWFDKGFTKEELLFNSPPDLEEFQKSDIIRYFFGYFENWSNHENYYYAKENTGLTENPERTEGTYTRYSSFDDKIDGYHQWFMLIKFGIGRCTANAAREVREGYRTREEAVELVTRYDQEFPSRYFPVLLDYCQIDEEEFWAIADSWYNEKIWEKKDGKWELKYQVS